MNKPFDSAYFASEKPSSLPRFLSLHQQLYLIFLGSLLTIFAVILEDVTLQSNFLPSLFIIFLIYPVTVSFLLIKSSTWRKIPLSERMPVVRQGFFVSWLATFMIPVTHLLSESDFYIFILMTACFTAVYGYFLLKTVWQLQDKIMADLELFP